MLFDAVPPNPAFNPTLVHAPVMLRPGKAADYPAWASIREASREHLTAWEESWTPEQATMSAFRRRLKVYDRDARRGGGLSLLCFRLTDDVLLGGATLTNIRYGASRSGILGYWIGAPFVRLGYAAAAVSAVKTHAFERLGLNRLIAACQPGNVASQKLLERSGFVREGLARDYLRINGVWRDHNIYAFTAADYDKAESSPS